MNKLSVIKELLDEDGRPLLEIAYEHSSKRQRERFFRERLVLDFFISQWDRKVEVYMTETEARHPITMRRKLRLSEAWDFWIKEVDSPINGEDAKDALAVIAKLLRSEAAGIERILNKASGGANGQ